MSSKTAHSNRSPVRNEGPLYALPIRRDPPRPPSIRPGGLANTGRRMSHLSESTIERPRGRTAGGTSIMSGRAGSINSAREIVAEPHPADIQRFTSDCKAFYILQDATAGARMSAALDIVPPAQKAAYTRVQASVRSLAHIHHLRVRITSLHALINTLSSSGSLSIASRNDLGSTTGQRERRDRLHIFLETWCSPGGVEPFFRGLWAVLSAQARHRRRVVWEIDDAVFLQSGGTEFMSEAVTMLKGVLGFDEQLLDTTETGALIGYPDEALETDLNAPRYRLWTFPAHITDEEANTLLRIFPAFVQLVRGRVQRIRLPAETLNEDSIQYGTGRIWLGEAERHESWAGGIWFRFVRWVKGIFSWYA